MSFQSSLAAQHWNITSSSKPRSQAPPQLTVQAHRKLEEPGNEAKPARKLWTLNCRQRGKLIDFNLGMTTWQEGGGGIPLSPEYQMKPRRPPHPLIWDNSALVIYGSQDHHPLPLQVADLNTELANDWDWNTSILMHLSGIQ